MIAERMNKYKQLAFNYILGWLIHDIWSFIEREDFPEELKKSEQQFKNRLEEIQSLAKTLKKLRQLNFESRLYSNLLDEDTAITIKKADQLANIDIKHLEIAQIKECYGNDIILEEEKWLERVKPFISEQNPRYIENLFCTQINSWYKKHIDLLTFMDEAPQGQLWSAFSEIVATGYIIQDLIEDQLKELSYFKYLGDQLAKDGFDLKSQKTKNYLEFEFNSTTDHLRSIKDFFSYLEKDYTKISFEEFMERFNGLDTLLRRWQAVGIVSAQKALKFVNQEPYPKIDFFDLDQAFIDEVKEPKKWYVDVNQTVLI